MSALPAPISFDVDVDVGRSNAARWSAWLRSFELFKESSGISGERKMMLHVSGSQVQEIYEAISVSSVEKNDEKGVDSFYVRLKTLALSCVF